MLLCLVIKAIKFVGGPWICNTLTCKHFYVTRGGCYAFLWVIIEEVNYMNDNTKQTVTMRMTEKLEHHL